MLSLIIVLVDSFSTTFPEALFENDLLCNNDICYREIWSHTALLTMSLHFQYRYYYYCAFDYHYYSSFLAFSSTLV